MKNKFTDYLSSEVVSQTTLLLKFNKILDYLKNNPTINVYQTSLNYDNTITTYSLTTITPKTTQLYNGDMVLFANGYYGFVESVGDITFTILNAIALPSGKDGNGIALIEADSPYEDNGYTVTPIQVNLTDSSPENFEVKAKNGENGTDGRSIESVTTISHSIVGNETVTTVRLNYSNGKTENIEIHAKNGSSYQQFLLLKFNYRNENITYECCLPLIGSYVNPNEQFDIFSLLKDTLARMRIGTTFIGYPINGGRTIKNSDISNAFYVNDGIIYNTDMTNISAGIVPNV